MTVEERAKTMNAEWQARHDPRGFYSFCLRHLKAARAEGYREAMEKADLLGDGSMREGL